MNRSLLLSLLSKPAGLRATPPVPEATSARCHPLLRFGPLLLASALLLLPSMAQAKKWNKTDEFVVLTATVEAICGDREVLLAEMSKPLMGEPEWSVAGAFPPDWLTILEYPEAKHEMPKTLEDWDGWLAKREQAGVAGFQERLDQLCSNMETNLANLGATAVVAKSTQVVEGKKYDLEHALQLVFGGKYRDSTASGPKEADLYTIYEALEYKEHPDYGGPCKDAASPYQQEYFASDFWEMPNRRYMRDGLGTSYDYTARSYRDLHFLRPIQNKIDTTYTLAVSPLPEGMSNAYTASRERGPVCAKRLAGFVEAIGVWKQRFVDSDTAAWERKTWGPYRGHVKKTERTCYGEVTPESHTPEQYGYAIKACEKASSEKWQTKAQGLAKTTEQQAELSQLLAGLAERLDTLNQGLGVSQKLFDKCDGMAKAAATKTMSLRWKSCMSDKDLTGEARRYAVTDTDLYTDFMNKAVFSCGSSTGLGTKVEAFMKTCSQSHGGGPWTWWFDEFEPGPEPCYESDMGTICLEDAIGEKLDP